MLIPAIRRFANSLLIALVLCIVFSAVGIVAVNAMINSRFDALQRTQANVAEDTALSEPANYLLVGSDNRDFVKTKEDKAKYTDSNGESGDRADTMMIIHVDPKQKKTIIMAIRRDSKVHIPGIGTQKINAATNPVLGGSVDKLIETIDTNFDIPIQHYIRMDFNSFKEVVNAVGPVNVYFPYPARDIKSGLDTAGKGGCLGLDGDLALAYVRSRYYEEYKNGKWVEDPTSAVGRIARQQEFMKRVATIAIKESLSDPLAGRDVVDGVAKHLEVDQNFNKNAIFKLMNAFKGVDPNDTDHVVFETLPADSKYENGVSYDIIDYEKAEPLLEQFRDFSTNKTVAKDFPKPETVKLKILNTTKTAGLAAKIESEFTSYGFVSAGSGNSAAITKSEIHYNSKSKSKAELVATYINASLVEDNSIADADVVVYLGSSFTKLLAPSAATSSSTTATTSAPTTVAKSTSKNTEKPAVDPAAACKA
jgi:LCP family protein required for cell wall assembly